VLELRNLGFTQLEQLVADPEQVRQGEVQLLHVLSVVSPQNPLGQLLVQVLPLKKVVPEHDVQVVADVEHFTQGKVQALQVLSLVSPILIEFFFLFLKYQKKFTPKSIRTRINTSRTTKKFWITTSCAGNSTG
jgi:hypothetical protein